MNNSGDIPAAADPADQQGLLEYYRLLSGAISETAPEDLARQIPGLAQDIASHSTDSDSIVRFEVGISFTGTYSLLDYSLIRVHPSESGDMKREAIKKPVSRDHHYIGFSYPRDPYFDNRALRGVLLSVLSHRILETRESPPDDEETVLSGVWGLLGDLHEG